MPADNKTADKPGVPADQTDQTDQTDQRAGRSDQRAGRSDLAATVVAASTRHATLRYATLRIAIFVVSLGVLWGAVALTGHIVTGNGALYLMMGALLLSGIASFFLLSRQRDAMSAQVTARAERMTDKFQANAALEDED